MLKAAVVLTTIHPPLILKEYAQRLSAEERDEVRFLVVGDRKTPEFETQKIVSNASKHLDVKYYNVADQKRWLADFPQMNREIPYDSDNRRNVGYLIAARDGIKTIINLDDDNFPTDDKFLPSHLVVGTSITEKTVHSTSGWFNPCAIVSTNPPRRIYARGFPYSMRGQERYSYAKESGRVLLNEGLWFKDPDADAVTNLNERVQVEKLLAPRVVLGRGVFAPLNTQNTAIATELLPAYYYVRMGLSIGGLKIDRYGDIWQGYFVQLLMHRFNDRIAFGVPMSDHRRNKHDFMHDVQAELYGMIVTERLTKALHSFSISSRTYADGYLEVADQFTKADLGVESGVKKLQTIVGRAMRIWVETCDRIS